MNYLTINKKNYSIIKKGYELACREDKELFKVKIEDKEVELVRAYAHYLLIYMEQRIKGISNRR